jgi:hypothetical protein
MFYNTEWDFIISSARGICRFQKCNLQSSSKAIELAIGCNIYRYFMRHRRSAVQQAVTGVALRGRTSSSQPSTLEPREEAFPGIQTRNHVFIQPCSSVFSAW